MTNEKMLQVVNQMLKEKINTMELLKIKQQLELDVLKDAGKTAGKAKLQTVALKILKKHNAKNGAEPGYQTENNILPMVL